MNFEDIMKSIDNLFISINNNKIVLIFILILLAIYYINLSEEIVEKTVILFNNDILKFIIVIVITYISNSSPAIGISLAIILITSLQIMTNIKLKKDRSENFSKIDPVDMDYLKNEFLTDPLQMQKNQSPLINYNLKLVKPKDMYNEMIKKGKLILEENDELEEDLKKRYDIREQQIANLTKKSAIDLIESGMNRLQISNQGEYKII